MPANFEANVIGVVPRTAPPPQPAETHEQAMQRLAAAQIALKAAQQAKDTAVQNLAAARREDDAATYASPSLCLESSCRHVTLLQARAGEGERCIGECRNRCRGCQTQAQGVLSAIHCSATLPLLLT